MHVGQVFCFALAISSKNKWASRRSSLGKLFRRKDRRSQGKKNAAKRFSEPVPRPGKYGFGSHLGQLTFSLKGRESEPSQVVLLCCLALFIMSQLFNHVHVHVCVHGHKYDTGVCVYNVHVHEHEHE